MPPIKEQHDFHNDPMIIFWLIKTTPAWLALPPHGENGRFAFGKNVLDPILARHPGAQMRFFDSEAYNAEFTDVMMWTVRNLADYNAAVNDLRETKFWESYFVIERIIPSFENEYAKHYKVDVIGQSIQIPSS